MKILIYNVNWRGDVLFSAPAIRAIKRFYPGSRITCLVTPRCRDILKSNPDVAHIISFDERRNRSLSEIWAFIRSLKKQSFDMVFLFHRSFSRALMMRLAGIPQRIGYATKRRGFLLTRAVEPPKVPVHKVDYFLGLARACGADASDRFYRFYLESGDESRADELLRAEGIRPDRPLVVINPGGNWTPKRWPPGRYAELARLFVERTGYQVVITGAPKDQALGEEVKLGSAPGVISLCGKTSLGELGGVMRRAQLVVANDTGPMHIAVGVGAPTLALFGPTRPELTGPIGPHAHVLSSRRGMDAIQVEEVFRRAQELLSVARDQRPALRHRSGQATSDRP
ncbi:MAG: lipopolysaccharide heptosyltransferase II [Candidatus Omnitrophica bacterium]|nr:lipopolysaccharide heptosyltransferase II [Candidatus Omnitrophota bacterium]